MPHLRAEWRIRTNNLFLPDLLNIGVVETLPLIGRQLHTLNAPQGLCGFRNPH
jgi:hypothetical protein